MFPVIDAHGGARERGRIHGAAARQRVARSVATYARLFAFCGMDWREAQRRGAGYRDAIEALGGQLLEEIEGIAEGSGRQVDEILALNARTEILPPTFPGDPHPRWRELDAGNRASGVPDLGECTAIAVPRSASATGETLLAQNWDWLGAQRGALVVLRVRGPDGPACLTLTEAGMLAKIGLNQHGFGVCLNILRSSADGERAGHASASAAQSIARLSRRCRGDRDGARSRLWCVVQRSVRRRVGRRCEPRVLAGGPAGGAGRGRSAVPYEPFSVA